VIDTTPETILYILSTNGGENHNHGWTFELTGDGDHDHLFLIINNELRAGYDYIPPGTKRVHVRATHTTYDDVERIVEIDIDDFGMLVNSTTTYRFDDVIPSITDNYIFNISYKLNKEIIHPDPGDGGDYSDSDISLVSLNGTNHVIHHPDGSVTIDPIASGVSPTTCASGLIQGNDWFTLTIIREDRGSGVKTYYMINDIDIVAYTTNPLEDILQLDLPKILTGVTEAIVTNVMLAIDGVTIINDELKDGPTWFTEI